MSYIGNTQFAGLITGSNVVDGQIKAADLDPLLPVNAATQQALDLKLNVANPSYTGGLTGDTGIVNIGSGQFYKDTSGNIGVGNTNPSAYGGFVAQLTSGIALHSNSVTGVAGLNLYENGTGRFSLRTLNGTSGLSFFDTFVGQERAKIDANGGFTSSKGINITGNGGFFNAANKFGQDQLNGAARMYSSGPDASTRGSFEWHLTSSDGQLDITAMSLENAGKLSVTSPNLNIANFEQSNVNGFYITITKSGTVYGDIGTANQVFSGGATTDFGINARNARCLVLGTNNTSRFVLDTVGNALLGGNTITPLSGIFGQVIGSSTKSTAGLALSTSGRGWLLFTANDGTYNNRFSIYDTTASAERVRIDTAGNFGISVTPAYRLDVHNGSVSGQKLFRFTGAASLYGYSDSGGVGITSADPYTSGMMYYQQAQNNAHIFFSGQNIAAQFSNTVANLNTKTRIKADIGTWHFLGTVQNGGSAYIHVKMSVHRSQERMVLWRLTGFYPYNAYAESYMGCYAYQAQPSQPYGQLISNQGNQPAANNMYYSSDGYVVLCINWAQSYTGVNIELIASGQNYGFVDDSSILAYTHSNSTTGVY